MRYILGFLLIVYISLLVESLAHANPHPKLEPTYPLVIRIWCNDEVTKFIHTKIGIAGVFITIHNHNKMDPKVIKAIAKAVRTGFSYDMKDCSL